MAKGINKVILIGSVGKDPEIKFMPNGNAVANLSLATSESWKDKNTQEKVERTEWHRVVFYQKLAEIVGEYVKKGSKIYIEGSLRTRSWEKEGNKFYVTEIIADNMQMLDGPKDSAQGQRQAPPANNTSSSKTAYHSARDGAPAHRPSQPEPQDNFDDDIPF